MSGLLQCVVSIFRCGRHVAPRHLGSKASNSNQVLITTIFLIIWSDISVVMRSACGIAAESSPTLVPVSKLSYRSLGLHRSTNGK